jgi:hypothetical protein
MKIARVFFTFIVVVGILGVSMSPSQAQKLNPYSSALSVQNMSGVVANITLTYYNPDGTVSGTAPDTLNPNEAKSYPTLPNLTAGFSGSAVISSDQPLAAISNLNHTSSGTVVARDVFPGSPNGANTVYLPLLASKLGAVSNDTWFSIQNAGGSVATVNIVYSDCATGNPAPLTIQPGAAATVNNAPETCHTSHAFSGTVTSDQPVVVVVVQEKPYSVPAYPNGVMFAYSGLTNSGSTSQIFPVVTFNNSGNRSGIQVQNTTATSSDITIAYTPYPPALGGTGTACTEKFTVGGNQSVTFGWPTWGVTIPPGYAGISDCVRGQRFIGSALISANTANVNVQTVVSQTKDGTNRGAEFVGFQPSQATGKFVMPVLLDRLAANVLISYVHIFNADPVNQAFYKCTISGSGTNGAKSLDFTGTLPASGAGRIDQLNQFDTNFVGSGVCQTYTDATFGTLNPAGKIIGVVGLTTGLTNQTLAGYYNDQLQLYSAFNTTQ